MSQDRNKIIDLEKIKKRKNSIEDTEDKEYMDLFFVEDLVEEEQKKNSKELLNNIFDLK